MRKKQNHFFNSVQFGQRAESEKKNDCIRFAYIIPEYGQTKAKLNNEMAN